MDRNLDVPSDRGRSTESHVRGAEDLFVLEDVAGQDRLLVGADPEFGHVGSVRAVNGQEFHQLRTFLPGRINEVTTFDGQFHRFRNEPDTGNRAIDDQDPLGRGRADEAFPAGKVAEGPGCGQLAGVGNRGSSLETETEVAAVIAGDPGFGSAVEQLGHPSAAAPQVSHVVAHHPGQHLDRRPRQRRGPGPRLGGAFAGGGV